jgi:ABC-type transporter Mla maintaining outer membrane lipid asymmetry permease subunit MlaE
MVVAVFSLTLYFLMVALASGYGFAFVQNAALTPGEFGRQLSLALTWQDFPLLAAKSVLFGALIAATTCYQGLARPLRTEELARVTSRALVQSVMGCVLVDLVFMALYMVILAG